MRSKQASRPLDGVIFGLDFVAISTSIGLAES